MSFHRIGIAGFGIAGAAAAALLCRQGHEVYVFEHAAEVAPVGNGLLLQPSGQQVLQRLGIWDRVAAVSEPLDGLHAVHPDGRTLIRLQYADAAPNARGFGVHRAVLFDALVAAATGAGVNVRLNAEVTGCRVSGSDRAF